MGRMRVISARGSRRLAGEGHDRRYFPAIMPAAAPSFRFMSQQTLLHEHACRLDALKFYRAKLLATIYFHEPYGTYELLRASHEVARRSAKMRRLHTSAV